MSSCWLRPLGDNAGQPVKLVGRSTTLGRAEDNDIQAAPRSVSGYHAELELLDGGVGYTQGGAEGLVVEVAAPLDAAACGAVERFLAIGVGARFCRSGLASHQAGSAVAWRGSEAWSGVRWRRRFCFVVFVGVCRFGGLECVVVEVYSCRRGGSCSSHAAPASKAAQKAVAFLPP